MVVITILMAAGLPNLEFHSGRLLEIIDLKVDPTKPFGTFLGAFIISFIRFILLLSFVVVPFLILYFLSRPQGRILILACLCLGVLLAVFMKYYHGGFDLLPPPESNIQNRFSGDVQPFLPGEQKGALPPRWLVISFSLGLSAVIIGALIFLWHRLQGRDRPLHSVAGEAKRTLEKYRSGGDLKEGVILCYFEMIRVVRERRGLERGRGTTTRELENDLEALGLPAFHVRTLTRLFEKVRYGAKYLSRDEEREALSCLTAIVDACEGSR